MQPGCQNSLTTPSYLKFDTAFPFGLKASTDVLKGFQIDLCYMCSIQPTGKKDDFVKTFKKEISLAANPAPDCSASLT